MLKSAFALIGFKAYLWVIEEIIGIKINIEIAALVLLALLLVNILGVKRIKKVQTPIVLISVSYLLALCAYALVTVEMNWDNVFSRTPSVLIGKLWPELRHSCSFLMQV